MFTLQIEHGIKDFALWKGAFDADPLDRAASGVLASRVARPVGDDHYVVIELDFGDHDAAEGFLARLRSDVWNQPAIAPALAGAPTTRILEQVAQE
ncbi:hypothetical protein [Arthrobacter sp. 35W]|uniref:hypothetical protein n=1 Tax=Arthrobacter sp. 35W TaxID=1132441 RepID=UPI0004110313|nr:hypothetical protein [Arthrobacter sp. 35W]